MDRILPLFTRRVMECRAWNVISRVYRRATTGRDVDDNVGPPEPSASPSTSSSSSRGEAFSSPGRDRTCSSEACRYCRAVEKTLLWEDFTFFVNVYLIIVLSVTIWIYGVLGISTSRIPFRILTVYLIIQLMVAFKFMDTLAPSEEHQRVCSRLHWLWRSLRQLRSEQPGLHCVILCLVAFGLWLFGRINPSTHHSIYWGIVLGPLIMRLPLKLSDKLSEYFKSHREWECDSEIGDEFLPVVTEANLQVLNRVGDTGDHSPTPTSVLSDTQNDSFYDEDFIEAFQEKMLSLTYYGEGSTDGVEMSELELSAGENDAEGEEDIKFQTGHFEKSSSSSSEEEAFDANKIEKIAVSSDESNSDSDFEIIDKEEIVKMEM
ncbi:uncharacterized protein LOC115243903 [Formica exsecta]|uniref:uncharacterized protein LOC115243903 n=1 Tax=Formica exsecta TaxID=72781 RepID=UPI001142B794|nr:uncharacterized protein LOC115243903 [Formica exsecta]